MKLSTRPLKGISPPRKQTKILKGKTIPNCTKRCRNTKPTCIMIPMTLFIDFGCILGRAFAALSPQFENQVDHKINLYHYRDHYHSLTITVTRQEKKKNSGTNEAGVRDEGRTASRDSKSTCRFHDHCHYHENDHYRYLNHH